ncbi:MULTISPECIES: TetR/AcrR family transcriptional regulator [Roseovarius]|uniref:TetR/AcrR family transcriptional regulator n=1 Tax=Roseovarius TaxID=74030 RepID=UPI001C974A96|nr:TetR/AcrR family transcriptional regulator [Roseovarius atlanticus]MBY5990382.1 TetR/AcrR family transcriptional regulator [Roseovarius atlanticus]MBY6126928.1 TetR/AcrR family transcriptional regulator [Roseovarius atlanticus]MBY6151421.1 TetR/AcrR family transcriptional regulator [Roseovarius atlanticus]
MARTQGSHSQFTGPKVRDAALRLFAQHGFAAVSMRQIAAEVGVQAGALYNYTPDKQTLLFDLMQEHMDDLLAAWCAEDPGGADPFTRLEAFTRFHIRFNTKRADAVFVSYMELRNLTPENFETVTALRGAYETRLQDILTAGTTQGVFTVAEPRITAMAVIALLTGVNTWYREEGRLTLDEVETLYWNMVRRMVGG